MGGGENLDNTHSTNTGDRVDIPDSNAQAHPKVVANISTPTSPEQELEDKLEVKSAQNSQGHGKTSTPLESPLTPLEDSQSTNTPDPSVIAGGGDLATPTALLDSYSIAAELARGLGVNKSTIGRNITKKTKDEAIAWCTKNGCTPYYYDSGLKVFVKA